MYIKYTYRMTSKIKLEQCQGLNKDKTPCRNKTKNELCHHHIHQVKKTTQYYRDISGKRKNRKEPTRVRCGFCGVFDVLLLKCLHETACISCVDDYDLYYFSRDWYAKCVKCKKSETELWSASTSEELDIFEWPCVCFFCEECADEYNRRTCYICEYCNCEIGKLPEIESFDFKPAKKS